jgi:predicted dehydrogenase
MASGPLRVGLLGVAGISSKTALAISNPETDCEVRAVASRSQEKAEVCMVVIIFVADMWITIRSPIFLTTMYLLQNFISQFFSNGSDVEALGGPTAYDDLINSDLLDAVYIPLPVA